MKVNDALTLLFEDDASFDSHHYAFHVSDAEFDAIFHRVQEAGLTYGSAPWSAEDGRQSMGWRPRRRLQNRRWSFA